MAERRTVRHTPCMCRGVTLAPADPTESAAEAGLHYVDDNRPGLRRRRAGAGFAYFDTAGKRITDPRSLLRLKHLVIPPAWTAVWICPDPRGHLQATGRDARGRKVYLYHPRWREVRDVAKYERLAAFGEALPAIRERVDFDLRRHGVPHEKVLAAVVKLLEETSIRIGNEEYRRENGSVGLTTMHADDAEVAGARVRFVFTGKHGKEHDIALTDRRLARIVKQIQELPGQELFQYLDEHGEHHAIGSAEVNEYIKSISGGDFSAKDFRTWNGTVLAMRFLRVCERPASATAGKRQVSGAIKQVARELGNTPAVARRAYVHPVVVNAYLEGYLQPEAEAKPDAGLTEEEACVLKLLEAEVTAPHAA